ncbi:MAG TPA: PIG-L family deacetylase [Roseiflexaceae bacterium]|nr:PIG-L family deacetylase [Roseiflexaceae bacterium]
MSTIASTTSLRILGLFAHPDDEVFVAGGTLAKYAAEGAEIMVISSTRGQAGQIRDSTIATRRTLGAVREQELRLSATRLGVQHALCWDYDDGTLQTLDSELLIRDAVAAIRDFRPDIVLSFGPDGGYGHPDHIVMCQVAAEAVRRAGDPTQFPEQLAAGLAPHQPWRYYQSSFPANRLLLLERLVHWLVQHKDRFQGSLDFIQAMMLLCEESTMLKFASDFVETRWYPQGFYIIEQGEAATKLYLILSGRAQAIVESVDGDLRPMNYLEPGMFFGEQGLAYHHPRNAHVVAAESTTCLVISPSQPTNFAGRGENALLGGKMPGAEENLEEIGATTTHIDVSEHIARKLQAMAAHRSQFIFDPDMLPLSIFQELFGHEYFVRVYPQRELRAEL